MGWGLVGARRPPGAGPPPRGGMCPCGRRATPGAPPQDPQGTRCGTRPACEAGGMKPESVMRETTEKIGLKSTPIVELRNSPLHWMDECLFLGATL